MQSRKSEEKNHQNRELHHASPSAAVQHGTDTSVHRLIQKIGPNNYFSEILYFFSASGIFRS